LLCNEENLLADPGAFSLTGATLRLLGLSATRTAWGVVRRHIYNYAGHFISPAV